MRHTFLLLFVSGILLVAGNLLIDRWPTTLHYGDSNGYYLHVVSFFVNQDVGDYDRSITSLKEINPNGADPRTDEFGIRLTEKGRRYIKYTLGVAVMETPFFWLAHLYAKASPEYEANGWTTPYMLAVGFSIVCYVLLGLFLLIGVLKRYFSDIVVTLVVLSLILATNLFYQTNYVTMSHGFLFFQHCLLIWLTVRFYDRPSWLRALGVGAAVGLITLTRVPEIVSVLVALLWGVAGMATLKERFRFFTKNYPYLLLAGLGFLLVFSLQFAYWYYVSGHLIFNPYQGEGFNLLKPRFWRALFDFKNGWLIYTPIMAFSLAGLFLLPRHARGIVLPLLAFLALHVWVHYSYYVFSYFPGLGQRPMVETYPLLSFGLAAAFSALLSSNYFRWVPWAALLLFGALNLFQTWQSREGIIWSERNNAAYYWATFGTMKTDTNTLRAYDTNTLQPEEEDIELVDTLASENFDAGTRFNDSLLTRVRFHSDSSSLLAPQEYVELTDFIPLDESDRGRWLKAGIWGFMEEADRMYNRDYVARLVITIYDAEGKERRDGRIPIAAHIGNDSGNIWMAGYPNQWGIASFYQQMPNDVAAGWSVRILIVNGARQKIYLDDFSLARYRSR